MGVVKSVTKPVSSYPARERTTMREDFRQRNNATEKTRHKRRCSISHCQTNQTLVPGPAARPAPAQQQPRAKGGVQRGSEDDTYKFNGERRQINEQQSNTRKTETSRGHEMDGRREREKDEEMKKEEGRKEERKRRNKNPQKEKREFHGCPATSTARR